MPEVARIVEQWQIGAVIADHQPESIADAIERVLQVPNPEWRTRCELAALSLHWEAEEQNIQHALKQAGA